MSDGQSTDVSYQWIECGNCSNLYPVGGRTGTDPVETSPESAEHHEEGCPVRLELESRRQTAERSVHADTDRGDE